MSEASNFDMQDPNAAENMPAGLAAEIERALAEKNLASSKSSDSEGRMLDAICDAVIAETPNVAAELEAKNTAEPLASLLKTVQAGAHEYVNPDTRQECAELLEEIDKAAEACVAEYSLSEIAQSAQESGELIAEDSSESTADSDPASAEAQTVKLTTSEPVKMPVVHPAADRRRRRRALISAPVRVRGIDLTKSGPGEISTTVDVSRFGILFSTSLDCYSRGMDVMVTFPYSSSQHVIQAEQHGRVVRVHEGGDGRRRVAIALGLGVGEDLVDSSGRKFEAVPSPARKNEPVCISAPVPVDASKKPLILTVDSEAALRDSLKAYLENEGYEVIAVSSNVEAREVLDIFTPALVIAEVEGENLPGFDVCAHVKSSSRLRHIPVVLITRSAYPSDYSNAHSIGAVVCMAKPFKQERLGHVVRLLAPLPVHMQPKFVPRPGDPTRRPGCETNANGRKKSSGPANGNGKRFRFPSFR
ncbi:MAG TPA: response regulator [Candidatus Acidoferrales bacterium]|nr:response regulator [Candidatus Acidoferrales bacterium]